MSDSDQVKPGHTYDGIEELDHPIPNWFQILFIVTIVFGVGYVVHYELGNGPGLTVEYHRDLQAFEYAQYKNSENSPKKSLGEAELIALVKDPDHKAKGSVSFQSKCASCHGAQGQGGIGPNLTDAYWIHGGKMIDVVQTISKGVADKGMPPWGPVLGEVEIQSLAVYIRTLQGTKPEGAKAPQGNLVKLD